MTKTNSGNAIDMVGVGVEDRTIIYNSEELSKRMIERFKASECFQSKSIEEREKIIQYLKDNPRPDNPYID